MISNYYGKGLNYKMVQEAVIGLLLGVLSFGVVVYVFLVLPTKWVKVERNFYDLGIGTKVLQISDLHMERLRVSANQLLKIIVEENPNYIFFTGDFLDTAEAFSKLEGYLKIIEQTKIPTYAVLGNHDYYLEDTKDLVKLLKSHKVNVLINEHMELDDFTVVGIDDYGTQLSNPTEAFESVNRAKPVIVLTHDPNLVLVMEESYDYLLSGHLHGKQVNLPFLFKVMPMGELPRGGIYKGEHKNEYGSYYISKGLGQTVWNIRFMVRSEVTLHQF